MAIATMAALQTAMFAAQRIAWMKNLNTGSAVAAGQFFSGWAVAGTFTGDIPGAAATCDNTTTGALPVVSPPSGSNYLASVIFRSENPAEVHSLLLYDRLAHMGGLDGTSTGAQTVDVSLPSRPDTLGGSVEIFVECYAQLGATSVTATISYTNQSGTAGQSATVTIPANMRLGRTLAVTLQAGDTGVRSVETLTLSASTLTAGNFGVTLARRITVCAGDPPLGAGALELGLPKIESGACLWPLACMGGTSNEITYGEIAVVSG
jgi:hypothetical protein